MVTYHYRFKANFHYFISANYFIINDYILLVSKLNTLNYTELYTIITVFRSSVKGTIII